MHNIGKYIENIDYFLQDYMRDSIHYSKNYDKVKSFLINGITCSLNV